MRADRSSTAKVQGQFGWKTSLSAALSIPFVVLYQYTGAVAASSFPGTIRKAPSTTSDSNSWWPASPSSSDGGDNDEMSSSDWELSDDTMVSTNEDAVGESSQELRPNEEKTKSHIEPTKKAESETSRGEGNRSNYGEALTRSVPNSKPLQTLQKLQQMLDDTDYVTSVDERRSMNTDSSAIGTEESGSTSASDAQRGITKDADNSLWTSKDRSKYKRQQQGLRRSEEESGNNSSYDSDPYRLKEYQQQRMLEQQRQRYDLKTLQGAPGNSGQPFSQQSSDTDEVSDTDDGLGYVLPNLPVYLSDAEEDSDAEAVLIPNNRAIPQVAEPSSKGLRTPSVSATSTSTSTRTASSEGIMAGTFDPPMPLAAQATSANPPSYHSYPNYDQLSAPRYQTYGQFRQSQIYPGTPNPGSVNASSYYHANGGLVPPPPVPPYMPNHVRHYGGPYMHPGFSPYQPYPWSGLQQGPHPPPQWYPPMYAQPLTPRGSGNANDEKQSHDVAYLESLNPSVSFEHASGTENDEKMHRPPSRRLSFISIQKVTIWFIAIGLLSYSAVSPRNLPFLEYNQRFYRNFRVCLLAMVPPLMMLLFVCDTSHNNVNDLVSAFYNSFTIGYPVIFCLEIAAATVIRLGTFLWLESDAFDLAPNVPIPLLPWLLRENKYKTKRITLFVADFLTSCVASPIIEELCKVAVLRWTMKLPRNFKIVKKVSKNKSKGKSRSKRIAERILHPTAPEVINVNAYVTGMLAVSLGVKMTDAIRRVCMYTKAFDENKQFFAICRGFFPIQELCGVATSLALARRDVLGQYIPLWRLVLPAVVFHGMAIFRGMKPIFKWNSSTPWSEMQLSPEIQSSSVREFVGKAFPKVMWLIVLLRVMGYCVKNYYMINRQALKRTTTYAGKHAAFSAELATTEMLQRRKDK